MKNIFTVVSAFSLMLSVSAESINQLKNGDFSRYKVNWVTDGEVREEGKAGVLILSGKVRRASSRQVMEIDPEKEHFKISADISADKPVQVLIGFSPTDKNWKEINFRNVGTVSGTFAKLAVPAQKKSNTLVLDRIIKSGGGYAALSAAEDMSDLPNFNLASIKSVTQKDGRSVIRLARPLRKSLPAGMGIRLHKDGPTFLYAVNMTRGFPGRHSVKGVIGGSSSLKFRKGTTGGKLYLLVIPLKKHADVRVEFRNIKVIKVKN